MSEFTYKNAGVNINGANQLVSRIAKSVTHTHTPGVIAGIGGFASLFELDLKNYPDPVLVSGTDGVGTKLAIAIELNNLTTIGQDLVAMCVNDILTAGAKPLFFLDYYSTGKLDVNQAATVIESAATSCKSIDCALVGGETAEMPGFYRPGDFDIAGFAVGIVSKSNIINGTKISSGDIVIGIPSSGLHSNGYSLVRKILKEKLNNNYSLRVPGEKKSLGEILLTPTKIYVNQVLALMEKVKIRGLAHITGGGLLENVLRIIPKDLTLQIDITGIHRPPIFNFLQETAKISDDEMLRTFNCGVGMVVIVSEDEASFLIDSSAGLPIGKVISKNAKR